MPINLIALIAAGVCAMMALKPIATARVCTKLPAAMPSAVGMPALVPFNALMLNTNRLSGPGSRVSPIDASIKEIKVASSGNLFVPEGIIWPNFNGSLFAMKYQIVKTFLTLIFLFGAETAWAQACHTTEQWQHMAIKEIVLYDADKPVHVQAHIADDSKERAAGYQWLCTKEVQQTAALFVFSRNIRSAFHMRNVNVPLDIYFFDELGKLVDAKTMQPEPAGSGLKPTYYLAAGKFRYALEFARPQDYDLSKTPKPLTLDINSLL